jgi:uncharacterized membrane protein
MEGNEIFLGHGYSRLGNSILQAENGGTMRSSPTPKDGRRQCLASFFALSILVLSAPLLASSPEGSFTTFDVPGASYAFPLSMNEEGSITGYYYGAGGYHGFARDRYGNVTTFDVAGAVFISPNSINEEGTIVGSFFTETNGFYQPRRGFVRNKRGTITTLDGPSGPPGTTANSINEDGVIVGTTGWQDAFVLRKGGTFTIIDVPDATGTVAVSINAKGAIAGNYTDASGILHGFVRDASGTISRFDIPGGGIAISGSGAGVVSINDWGAIAGMYLDENFQFHGFARDAQGTISTFDAAQYATTFVHGLNNEGTIVGYYYGVGGYHGFVRNQRGNITTFDVPGGLSGSTQALSINDEGDVAGNYEDTNFATHCFVWRR